MNKPVDLLDVVGGAVAPDTVSIRGKDVAVYGIGIGVIAKLFRSFPQISTVMKDRAKGGAPDIDLMEILDKAPGAVAMLIAAGFGHFGEPEYERAAANLSVEEQIAVIRKIIDVTMPNGIGPFVESIGGMAAALDPDGKAAKALATTSAPPSSN